MGTYFLESVDASIECQDARMIADLLEKRIEGVGKENVVQVVTDNGANYKAAGKILMERIPTLYWSPCACHCSDLMLEDIGKLKAFKKPIARAEWWHAARTALELQVHYFECLGLRDGDELPAMPEISALMTAAKDKIRQAFPQQNKQGLLKMVMTIIDKRWETQMDHPLYGAALFLNPGKYFSIKESGDDELVGELRSCFNDVLAKMVADVPTRNKIDAQVVLYEDKRQGFSNVMAIENMGKRNPLDWWSSYGGRAIDLQRFAKRIVSLCASSSGCERNWSAFEFIHTKKRNRLQHRILNDNVFVSYNRKNMDRFQKRREKIGDKSYDPLIIDDFDWGNEWVDPTMPPPQGARGCPDDISWELVDEAVGASSSLQGRATMGRGPSNANIQYQRQRKRPAPTRSYESDDQEDDQVQRSSEPNGEDDDSDYVEDDVDVTDDDEDPTSADQDDENQNATMDDFDDHF
ncbi:uncharacterized protein LOC124656926 [Lolium rigidum]|uniref:uncharacterized protein LOC124656926 n=1 Tax=Lolium rigidum TaxID=89674 RepID=UPI001F5D0A01|nr:uncharacterized protein LOC124656926 [Lolium rigidum]